MKLDRGWAVVTALALAAVAMGWMALDQGELGLHLFLVFPVLSAEGGWGTGAVLLTFCTVVALTLKALGGMIRKEEDAVVMGGPRERRTSVSGVVLIGPIPIVMGTDRRAALIAMALALTVLTILLLSLLI